MRWVYNSRPSLSRFTEIWDVRIVLDKLKAVSPSSSLSLKDLTYKLVMLVALLSAQRGQTNHLLNIHNMTKSDSFFSFTIPELTKTNRLDDSAKVIKLMAFSRDNRSCVYDCLSEYIKHTDTLRSDDEQLFVSYVKPDES